MSLSPHNSFTTLLMLTNPYKINLYSLSLNPLFYLSLVPPRYNLIDPYINSLLLYTLSCESRMSSKNYCEYSLDHLSMNFLFLYYLSILIHFIIIINPLNLLLASYLILVDQLVIVNSLNSIFTMLRIYYRYCLIKLSPINLNLYSNMVNSFY